MLTAKLHLKKLLAIPLMVTPIVLGFAGAALAANPTVSSSPLPADQIVINSSCITVAQMVAAGQQAEALYVPGGPPAGLIINGNWMPAAMVVNSGEYIGANGCDPGVLPSNQVPSALPADQVTIAVACPSLSQVVAAAQDAISMYVPGGPPAGVITNGNWLPAGVAAGAGGYTGCSS